MSTRISSIAECPPSSLAPAKAAYLPDLGAQAITAAELPAPYQQLLTHERSMTRTLEVHAGRALSLRVHRARMNHRWLMRWIELVDDRERPYVFAIIRIELSRFRARARAQIEDGRIPLGRILHHHQIDYRARPSAYLRVASNSLARQVPWTGARRPLYGRHNTLWTSEGRTMAQIIEILPPGWADGPTSHRSS